MEGDGGGVVEGVGEEGDCATQFSCSMVHWVENEFGNSPSHTCKRDFPVHIIKINLQMANKLMHDISLYKVSKYTL